MRNLRRAFLLVVLGAVCFAFPGSVVGQCTAVAECPDGTMVACTGFVCTQNAGTVTCDGNVTACPNDGDPCKTKVNCMGAECSSHSDCGTGRRVGDSCDGGLGQCVVVCTDDSGFHCCGCKARTNTALTLKPLGEGLGLELSWTTEAEVDLQGFDIYRTSEDGITERVNFQLIPSRGDDAGGASYVLVDPSGDASFFYHLEEVAVGESRLLKPADLKCESSEPDRLGS